MRGIFDENAILTAERRSDRELTLSPFLLLGLFFALVLVCGLCFGLGYALGNRAARAAAAAPVQQPAAPAQTADAQSKPTASAIGLTEGQINADNLALAAAFSAPSATTAAAQTAAAPNSGQAAIPTANFTPETIPPAPQPSVFGQPAAIPAQPTPSPAASVAPPAR